MITAQALIRAQQVVRLFRQVMQRPVLALHHVRVKVRWPPYGLAGVVDNKIQPRILRHYMTAKCLHAGRMAQIQPENFQALAPVLEIRFRRVAHRRVARKPRRHDQPRAGAQQLDARLITDFYTAAREQRHAPAQVRHFTALAPVQFRAGRAKLVVEMMNLRVVLFADIAILRLDRFMEVRVVPHFHLLKIQRRKNIRRGKNFFATQFANARLVELGIMFVLFRRLALLDFGLHQ